MGIEVIQTATSYNDDSEHDFGDKGYFKHVLRMSRIRCAGLEGTSNTRPAIAEEPRGTHMPYVSCGLVSKRYMRLKRTQGSPDLYMQI